MELWEILYRLNVQNLKIGINLTHEDVKKLAYEMIEGYKDKRKWSE